MNNDFSGLIHRATIATAQKELEVTPAMVDTRRPKPKFDHRRGKILGVDERGQCLTGGPGSEHFIKPQAANRLQPECVFAGSEKLLAISGRTTIWII